MHEPQAIATPLRLRRSPAQYAAARAQLDLSLAQMAAMLEIPGEDAALLETAPVTDGDGRQTHRIDRLIDAYLEGWRPADWGLESPKPGLRTNWQIKQDRMRLKLSVSELAGLLDVGAQTVRRMEMREKNKTHRTPGARLDRLMDAYLDGWRPADWPLAA